MISNLLDSMFLVMFSENVYEWTLDNYGVPFYEYMGKSQKTLSLIKIWH